MQILDEGNVLVFQNGTWWHRNAFDQIVSKSTRPLADATGWRYMTGPCLVSGPDEDLLFRNERGQFSKGKLLDSSTVEAWGGMRGKLSMDRSQILWANGTAWTR